VAECAVIGAPHPDFGEGVMAVIVPKQGAQLDERDIRAALSSELAKYKQPKRVIITADLPRNAMGKAQKKELRDHHAQLFRLGKSF
jgi:malonyl-CoA/methylmalonyl-CoA synthetase